MALTELQLPVKSDLYNTVQNVAGEVSNAKHRWGLIASFLNSMGTDDLDAIGVATGQVRTDLINLRVMLNEIIALLNNEAVTPTNDPQTVIDNLRKIAHG